MAAPAILGRIAHELGADGVEVRVADELEQVRIFLAEDGFVPVAEEVSGAP